MQDETVDTPTPEELSRLIGDTYIQSEENRTLGYLSGIAMDGIAGHKDPVSILEEYFAHEDAFDPTDDELDQVMSILADSYVEE